MPSVERWTHRRRTATARSARRGESTSLDAGSHRAGAGDAGGPVLRRRAAARRLRSLRRWRGCPAAASDVLRPSVVRRRLLDSPTAIHRVRPVLKQWQSSVIGHQALGLSDVRMFVMRVKARRRDRFETSAPSPSCTTVVQGAVTTALETRPTLFQTRLTPKPNASWAGKRSAYVLSSTQSTTANRLSRARSVAAGRARRAADPILSSKGTLAVSRPPITIAASSLHTTNCL